MPVPIVLLGGPLDQQVMMVNEAEEPRLKFRVREVDEHAYVNAVYGKSDKPVIDFQEYEFREEVVIHHKSLAAVDEDIWLLEQFEPGYHGFGADIGAYDGIATSNTLLLEREGWQILCVEPQPGVGVQMQANRSLTEVCACSDHSSLSETFYVHQQGSGGYSALRPTVDHPIWHPGLGANFLEIQVKVCRLDTLLRKHGFPRLDVLSIDTEGTELDVLRGLDLEKWQPKAIVAESWDEGGPVVDYLQARGYRLVERREPNDLFLRA